MDVKYEPEIIEAHINSVYRKAHTTLLHNILKGILPIFLGVLVLSVFNDEIRFFINDTFGKKYGTIAIYILLILCLYSITHGLLIIIRAFSSDPGFELKKEAQLIKMQLQIEKNTSILPVIQLELEALRKDIKSLYETETHKKSNHRSSFDKRI